MRLLTKIIHEYYGLAYVDRSLPPLLYHDMYFDMHRRWSIAWSNRHIMVFPASFGKDPAACPSILVKPVVRHF
jgi:hypothetical protein